MENAGIGLGFGIRVKSAFEKEDSKTPRRDGKRELDRLVRKKEENRARDV